ncbi:hypothetical protein KP77_28460 [Jeotgalibacillus alimentarius]|uniref:Competence protein n=1 Tax=Jeotgalibacillus alimentarius TaxID=135826 RepID=A0A0C2RY55_9BACL|nr:competence protein ComK [Jeotgalibacillus alimentarius]KIL46719.1 hypothetical protein KP77_28460 [Jeotgalibacillus alimentarius]
MGEKKVNVTAMVDENTLALLRAKGNVYRSMMMCKEGIKYSSHSPITLLNDCCMLTGSTMLGSMAATTARLGKEGDIPFIVNPFKRIIVMPTHSPLDADNLWIFPQHIQAIHFHTRTATIIEFTNRQKLVVNLPLRRLNQKMMHAQKLREISLRDRSQGFWLEGS